MQNDRELSRNGSGYSDPTAYKAMRHVCDEEERFKELLKVLFYVTKNAGFHIEERMVIKDLKTGRIWR